MFEFIQGGIYDKTSFSCENISITHKSYALRVWLIFDWRNKKMDVIEEQAKKLWQGKGCDIDIVVDSINNLVGDIVNYGSVFGKLGINFPMEYVRDAMKNLNYAIETKDDYLLADCLFFEWKEIRIVFNELIEELK